MFGEVFNRGCAVPVSCLTSRPPVLELGNSWAPDAPPPRTRARAFAACVGSYCSNCAQMASTSAGVSCLRTRHLLQLSTAGDTSKTSIRLRKQLNIA